MHITLGGIALELVFGAIAFGLARRLRARGRDASIPAFCLVCVGVALVGHGAIYLARGVHYGFGDGAFLARLLGAYRVLVVGAAMGAAVWAAAYGGTRLAAVPARVFAGSAGRVVAMALLVFVGAGLVHGALAWSEIRWFPDPRWVAIMEDASVVTARAELAKKLAEAKSRGEPIPSAAEQERTLATLERASRPWPLDPVLATAVIAALVVGVVRGVRRSRRDQRGPVVGEVLPTWRTVASVVGALVLAVGLIFIVRQLGPPS